MQVTFIPVGAVSNCALPSHSGGRCFYLRLSRAVGTESLSHHQKRTKTGLVSNWRGLVNLLAVDVGVKFPVEVVVFAVHLGSEVADAGINIRVYIAEALIHVGAKIVYTLIHIAESLVHMGVKIDYPLVKIANSIVHIAEARIHIGVKIVYTLVKIADSIVHIAEALIHVGAKIVYPFVKIADSIVHIAEALVKIADSIVHITKSFVEIADSLALYGYHVIKNSRESQNKTNKERYEFNVGHGGYSSRGYSGNCMTFARQMSRGKSGRRGRSGGDYGVQVTFIPVGAVSNCACPVRLERNLYRTIKNERKRDWCQTGGVW